MALIRRAHGRRNIAVGEELWHASTAMEPFTLRPASPWWDGAPFFVSSYETARAFGEAFGLAQLVRLRAQRGLRLLSVPSADFGTWAKSQGLRGFGGAPQGLGHLDWADWRRLQEAHPDFQGIRVHGAFAADGSGYEECWGDGDEIALWNTRGLVADVVGFS